MDLASDLGSLLQLFVGCLMGLLHSTVMAAASAIAEHQLVAFSWLLARSFVAIADSVSVSFEQQLMVITSLHLKQLPAAIRPCSVAEFDFSLAILAALLTTAGKIGQVGQWLTIDW